MIQPNIALVPLCGFKRAYMEMRHLGIQAQGLCYDFLPLIKPSCSHVLNRTALGKKKKKAFLALNPIG